MGAIRGKSTEYLKELCKAIVLRTEIAKVFQQLHRTGRSLFEP